MNLSLELTRKLELTYFDIEAMIRAEKKKGKPLAFWKQVELKKKRV